MKSQCAATLQLPPVAQMLTAARVLALLTPVIAALPPVAHPRREALQRIFRHARCWFGNKGASQIEAS